MAEDVGGMGLPSVVTTAAFSFFQAANPGTAAYAMLTQAAANLLAAHGSPEQVEQWVTPMVEGRYFGTMCLSETQAGSSLADITTRAEPQGDGTYRVTGSKMWISGGEHELAENIVHLVLAKVPGGPAGVKGISLVLVPRFLPDGSDNGVVLAGLNHKMGYRGTVNTVLSFEGATGWVVGEEHRGLAYMFHMMNEARVGVGLGATAMGYTGYLKALKYARERPQGRPLGAKDPAAPQVPIVEHADVKRMLLAQKSYVEGALGLILLCAKLVDDEQTLEDEAERAQAHLLLELLTPIAKSWPSQWCLEANSLAIQVHGGYGYAREYDVEQHYRDNRLNPIHEGTHGVQALDLLGRKVTMQGGAALGRLHEVVGRDGRARAGRRAARRRCSASSSPRRCSGCSRPRGSSGPTAGGRGGRAGQRDDLPRSGRPRRRRLGVARAVPRRRDEHGRLLRRQARRRHVVLPLRAPARRGRSSTCSPPGTARRSTCRTPGSTGRRADRAAAASAG